MKKNIMMRLSALLLVAVLLTTCVISGTFAKYTTTNGATDTAKVAKWGVTISATSVDGKEYDGKVTTNEESAVLKTDAHILAPGSSVKFGSLAITGKPEVAVKIEYSAILKLTGWSVDGQAYMPLVFVIDGQEYSDSTVEGLINKVQNAIAAFSKDYTADTDLSTTKAVAVSCYWVYSKDADTDKKDTALGETQPTLSLTINCTVTQLDTYPVN